MFDVRTILPDILKRFSRSSPRGIGIELDAQRRRQHAGGEIFRVITGFFFG